MKRALKEATVWMIANGLGMAAYLSFESWLLTPRPIGSALEGMGQDAYNGIDQLYFWMTIALPILLVFTVWNITRIFLLWRKQGRHQKWAFLAVWLLVLAAWIATILYYGTLGHVLSLL